MQIAGIDFGCWRAYAFRQLKTSQGGSVWLKSKFISVRIRVAIVRRRRAASIAERIARVLPTGRRSRATAGIRNARPEKWQALQDKPCVRNKNRDPGQIQNGWQVAGRVLRF